ncbi:MAG: TSUP family transporter [Candidatus Latescibacteria bacterium]|nr:TSUP family transporter [bacterium]MBD3423615.1 TSUP family transporter [Candidatus Latescibacterota bacterium]
MPGLIITGALVLVVAAAMTMVGKGGGNFYVVIMALAGTPMHQAATSGQFILFSASVAAMIIFHRNRSVSWPLAVPVGVFTSLSALGGGYFSHLFSGFSLKLVFAAMLAAAGVIMLIPVPENRDSKRESGFGIINIRSGEQVFNINLWIALPAVILTGFGSGMAGVSGGSFLVPLMVLACGVPMRTAVGTAATLIAATALMGFAGHAARGDFNPSWAVPLAVTAIAGGIIGSRLSLKTRQVDLKRIFAFTNWLAAAFMLINALHTNGSI